MKKFMRNLSILVVVACLLSITAIIAFGGWRVDDGKIRYGGADGWLRSFEWYGHDPNSNTVYGDTNFAFTNTTGEYNVAVGSNALTANTGGYHCTALGYNSLKGNILGYENLGIGSYAGESNTTGNANVFIGYLAGQSNTEGNDNIFIGTGAGRENTTATGNNAIGFYALYSNTTGFNNTCLGDSSLIHNTDGLSNTAIGTSTLNANISGDYNTAIGEGALQYATSGDYNTAVGRQAGIGSTDGLSSTICLGAGSSATQSYQCVIGSFSAYITDMYVGRGVTYSSPTSLSLHATGSSGTNGSGASLVLCGGKATGTGIGGSLFFQTSDPNTVSGSFSQTLSTKLYITNTGALRGIKTTNGPVGTFTMDADASTDVVNTIVTGSSVILITPTNAAAATLVSGSHSPFIYSNTVSTGFTVKTADGGSAAGTETFNYLILN